MTTLEQSLPLLPAKPEIPDDAELVGATCWGASRASR